jgi:hypothetical protein
MGLKDRLKQYPNELSAGERQRVAIARALANNPSILLADEPTGNLDSVNSARIMEMLMRIQQERGMTLVVVTHENRVMRLFCATLAALLLFATPSNAADARAVLAIPRQSVEQADFRASGHLVRVGANGARTSYAITIKAHWFPGVLRVLVEIAPPSNSTPQSGPDARAHILLEMRPNGQNAIQIAHPGDKAPAPLPLDKWSDGPLGSGFSYEDFLEEQYFWPGQTLLEETKYGARDCDLLKSTPGGKNLAGPQYRLSCIC